MIVTNPVEDFFGFLEEGETKEAASNNDLKKKEREMWQQWKDNGMQKKDLRPLLNSIRPIINKQVNIWARQRDVPPGAIRAEFTNQAVNALKSYDPEKSAMTTHIGYHLKKAQRFVTTYQNPARIPENRIYQIQKLENAKNSLEDKLGREPTSTEIADEMQWSPRQVSLLQKEVRVALPASQFKSDPTGIVPSRQQEVLRLLPYDLTPDERPVFEYLYGVNGKPRLSPGQIATKLKITAPKVSRLKKSIADKYAKYAK